jgi:asparagine synthase (glutamine-hydrolysing)
MTLPGGRFTITFNGEIYNFQELREEMQAKGVTFRTQTDTEVILRLYEREGREMVKKLRGMFAFAIWDEESKSCFCARDPFGIKPFYYCVSGGQFCFASELRALIQAGLTSRRLNPQAVAAYFETGSVPEPLTLVDGVSCLKPGQAMFWKDGEMQHYRHWEPIFPAAEDGGAACDGAEAVGRLRAALLDSVRHHFVSDVPVGIFLSGGIDSTLVLALARELGQENISTFSIGVDDPGLDESSIARRTAAHFGAQHHERRLDDHVGRAIFDEFITSIDQPSIDGFNTYTVSAFAREHGMKVVLSGLGGDEVFGGYPSFSQVPRMARLSRLLGIVPGVRQMAGRFMEKHSNSNRTRRMGTFFQSDPCVATAYRAYRAIFSRRDALRLTAHYTGVSEVSRHSRVAYAMPPTPEDEVSLCEITGYMRNQLLKDSDVMSMAHGLELRVPLVDQKLFDSIADVPARVRLRGGKRFLLDAVPEIPTWVAEQPKRGFLFPYQRWAEASWSTLFDRLPVNNLGIQPSWFQRWSSLVLEHWMKTHHISSANNSA